MILGAVVMVMVTMMETLRSPCRCDHFVRVDRRHLHDTNAAIFFPFWLMARLCGYEPVTIKEERKSVEHFNLISVVKVSKTVFVCVRRANEKSK